MDTDLLIVGGQVAMARGLRRMDLGIAAGKIGWTGVAGRRELRLAARQLDASGCLVMPGAIDPHVHFALPIRKGLRTSDDFNTGTRAAAAGGVTTVIDYTTPHPGQRPWLAFRERRRLARGASHVDYSLHNVLIGWEDSWSHDLSRLARAGAPSVKLFLIYRDRGWQADDGMLFEVMEHCQKMGLLVCLHAENDALISLFTRRTLALPRSRRPGASGLALSRPPICEEEATARAIQLAQATGARLHLVHLSTAGAACLVGAGRQVGVRVSAETCPQYLTLDSQALSGRDGHLFACCPPLRGSQEREGLWQALNRGWLSAVATDHCTFTRRQKNLWGGDFARIPYGLPGVETSLRLTFTLGPAQGRIPLEKWVYLHTEGPARIFGLYPRKGSLKRGADADLLVWDPATSTRLRAEDLETRCDWNPYRGLLLRGMARQVLLRGREVAREGRFVGERPRGRFVARSI